MDRQERYRKKYARIKCPECKSTSRVIEQHTVNGVPGYQIRECSKCGNVFDYDYVIQATLQHKLNWNCI